MMSGDPVWCEQCQARGKRRQLVLYQWSSDEACYMCQDDDCTFPMGCTDMFKYTIVRNSEDLFSQRRKKRKSSLPPVTKTNHIAAPTPPIICDVSPPSLANGTFQAWKKPLPLKQGEGTKPNGASLSVQSDSGLSLDAFLNRSATPKFAPYGEVKTATTATNDKIKLPLSPIESTDIFSQGLDSKDFMSMFSENGNALMGTSCSPCDWDLDLDDIFPLGEDSSVPLSQGMVTSPPVLSNSLTAAATDTILMKQPLENIAPHLFTDSGSDCVVKLAENSVVGDSSTCQPPELEKAAPHLQTGTREGSFVKQAQCSASADSSRSQPSEPENIALHSLTDLLEDRFVKQAEHSPSTDSSSSQPSEPENMALHLHTDSAGDGVVKLAQYLAVPDSSKSQGIPQATNIAIIDDPISPLVEEDSTIQWTNSHSLCWLDAAMCILVHSRTLRDRLSQLNGNGESTVKTLHLAYQQAQELLLNYQKAMKTPSADRRSSKPRKSKSVKACHTSSEELLCVERATEILHGVREKVFESLRPTLRCELGKNESPVFALPLLLRENSLIEDLFRMEYEWEFRCDKCGFTKSDRMTRVLPTFPSVTPDFSLLQACHLRSCFNCGAADQKREMVFNRLPPFVMLHFVTGLSHNRLEELDCRYQDRQYRVSAVIRYKTQPDHFVAYIRDTQGNRWLQCDDLSHPVCRWQDTPPSIPPSQIHIVAWELQSNNLPSSNTLPTTSAETSTSRGSLLSDLGRSSVRSMRRNSTSSECSSLSSLQYNIDTVDLTTDVDLSGNLKNGSAGSTREAATTEGTENAVRRLSGMDMQKRVVASTSPSGSSQASQQTVQTGVKQPAQFRVAAAKVQPTTAKTNVARNLFTEKPPSPPRMCLAPLPMGKALSPKSQSSQDTKLEHVSSQPNLSRAAPILRSPNSAFTVYNGCGPKKNTPTLVVPPAVNPFKPKSESTPKNNPEKKTTFTADAFARQIASRAKVKEGRSKVAKPNTIRHLTQNASPSSPEIVNPSILNRFLRKLNVIAPQQTYPAVRRDAAKAAMPTNTTVSVSKGRKRALSTGTGPSKRTKVSALRNSTSTAPSSPALSTFSQKPYLQTDKQKTLTVNSSTSVSKRKISELLGNKKQFAGYQPRGMTSGTTLPEKRTKYVGQFAVSNSQQALRRPQSSQKTKAISPGMQRKSAREVVKASSKVVQAMKTDLSLSNKLVTSNTSNPSQQDRGGNNVMYSYKQKGAQMKTTVEKDVPNRIIPEGATSLKTACSQSNEQLTPPGNKKRLSETMSELCEKLGLPTDNVKMDSTVEDNFFDSFFDGDKSVEDFEISPSKDLLCLVADDNVNDSEFCQKLSAIGSLPTDTSKVTSPAKISDSNHNRVARRVTVSTEAKDSTVALVGKLSRTLQGSPASLQRKGHFTIAQLLKHRTLQTN